MRNIIGFWGYPKPSLIEKYKNLYPAAEWVDLDIDFNAEMSRIQVEMRDVLAQEKQSQKMLEEAFRGIGYGID